MEPQATILVVDDEAMVLNLVVLVLKKNGFHVLPPPPENRPWSVHEISTGPSIWRSWM